MGIFLIGNVVNRLQNHAFLNPEVDSIRIIEITGQSLFLRLSHM